MTPAGYSLVLLLVLATDVQAEPRVTTSAVTVRKRPGEMEAPVGQLPAGTAVVVIREEGRWLFVRANKIEGYVTRTTISSAPSAATAAAPDAAGWGASHASGGLLVEVVVDSAVIREAAAPSSNQIAQVSRGAKLVVIDAASRPEWVRARDAAGHEGWISRADVTSTATAATTITRPAPTTSSSRGASGSFRRADPGPLSLRVEVGVGFRSFGMDLDSNASGGLRNFVVDADAVVTAVRAGAKLRFGDRTFAGIDTLFQVAVASPGIEYPGPTSAPGTIPFRAIAAEVGGRLGLSATPTFDVALRIAGHYDAFLPRDVENVGMLPRERLLGVTAGARVEVAPRTSRVTAELRLDVLVYGERAQTPGLEDGTASTARAASGGATLRISLGRRWALFGDYDFGRTTTSWTGMSTRQPGVTSAHRVDTTQAFQLGVSAEL